MNTSEQFMNAFGVLERVVLLGADVDARDSFGNPALARAALDARQVVDEPLLPELGIDLQRILRLLLEAGGDPDWINPRTEQTLVESFRDDPFGPVLVTALGDR
ncbi:MAG TPA: hypothetical protein VHM89_16280 [Acidimicrobiales bacterium]|nr:hypothetical protein [Acidimicrobiales bacterium]